MVTIRKRRAVPDEAAFDAAISARADRWYAACLRITRNPALAEDALQDAMLKAWHKRRQFQGDAKLETWIHQIAVNCALQLLRTQRPGLFDSLEYDVQDPKSDVEQAYYDDELNTELGAALSRLSDVERVCFVLKHLEQWRLSEIAAEVGKSVGAVKQALFRAVGKLRTQMPALARENA